MCKIRPKLLAVHFHIGDMAAKWPDGVPHNKNAASAFLWMNR